MSIRRRQNRPGFVHPNRGFSLVEVLVALLVLSIGLLGLAFLQGQGMKFNTDAYARTQATLLAYDIVDRMRANDQGAGAGSYDVPTSTSATAKIGAYNSCKSSNCYCDKADGSVSCDTAELADYDLGKWYEAQDQSLPVDPNNLSTIAQNGNEHTITMRWRDRNAPNGIRAQVLVVEL